VEKRQNNTKFIKIKFPTIQELLFENKTANKYNAQKRFFNKKRKWQRK